MGTQSLISPYEMGSGVNASNRIRRLLGAAVHDFDQLVNGQPAGMLAQRVKHALTNRCRRPVVLREIHLRAATGSLAPVQLRTLRTSPRDSAGVARYG